MNEKKLKELILKLSLSDVPPTIQEYILNNIDILSDDILDKLISTLNLMSKASSNYYLATQQYIEFYKILEDKLHSKLLAEAKIIQEELLKELQEKQ